jgi:hypothetical protein
VASTTPADPAVRQVREDFNRLRGRLFQAVESWGPPGAQETAIKGVIRSLTYDMQTSLEATLRARNGAPDD